MSVAVQTESPEITIVRLSGKIGSAEWGDALQKVSRLLQTQTSTSILVIADDFAGWDQGDWGDLSFQRAHDAQIKRMAIVAERQWEDAAVLFAGQGLRRFEIRYFPPAQLPQAREWLNESGRNPSQGASR